MLKALAHAAKPLTSFLKAVFGRWSSENWKIFDPAFQMTFCEKCYRNLNRRAPKAPICAFGARRSRLRRAREQVVTFFSSRKTRKKLKNQETNGRASILMFQLVPPCPTLIGVGRRIDFCTELVKSCEKPLKKCMKTEKNQVENQLERTWNSIESVRHCLEHLV